MSSEKRSSTPPPARSEKTGGDVKDGMPEIDKNGFAKMAPLFGAILIIPRAIGMAIAVAIYKYGQTAMYDKNMKSYMKGDKGYLYAAVVVFGLMVTWLNNYPMLYKNMVMRTGSGNLRANMMIYKAAESGKDAPYVILETEGAIGAYNRANRSLTHFTENSLVVVVAMLLAGAVFPFPAFVCTCIFALGRIMHQIGYAAKGYGGHGLGFMVAMFAGVTLEMLCAVVAAKTLDVPMIGAMLKTEL
mmetsp:Transcript_46755/g.84422  ORF Transcript_46755/g.84422 Transcript_46755/m.84422 type:complete len:244 (+) Transcript_46755:64-795(+)